MFATNDKYLFGTPYQISNLLRSRIQRARIKVIQIKDSEIWKALTVDPSLQGMTQVSDIVRSWNHRTISKGRVDLTLYVFLGMGGSYAIHMRTSHDMENIISKATVKSVLEG